MPKFPKTEGEFHALSKEELDELMQLAECTLCGTVRAIGCNCWTKCECGWTFESGTACRNPNCTEKDDA